MKEESTIGINADTFVEDPDRVNLLEEHDKIYTIHGERKNKYFQRGTPTRATSPSAFHALKRGDKKRPGSFYEPLLQEPQESVDDEDDLYE